ncbi:MAG: DUF3127 domain-containing protein [Muribaculaceae bacterium]|nr:DUF3127 domain-containing protein [Muribaculaceae bacterium]
MEIEGKIIQDLGIQEGISKANNPWKKQEWVLETMGNYPRKVKFTVFGERRIDELKLVCGEAYKLSVDVESREFNGRWYTDVNVYGAMRLDGTMPGVPVGAQPVSQTTMPPFGAQPAGSPAVDPFRADDNNTDDLPF